jgi:hypothetical protein
MALDDRAGRPVGCGEHVHQDIGRLAFDVVTHPAEVLLHTGNGRLRVANDHGVERRHVFLEQASGLAGLAEVRSQVCRTARAAIVRRDAAQARSAIGLVPRQQHPLQLRTYHWRRVTLQGVERGDLTGGEVHGLAGLGTVEPLGDVAADLQSCEIGQAARGAEPSVRLHLRIGGDEVTGHDLSGECIRRGRDHEDDECHGQVALGYARETSRNELAVHHLLSFDG